jgi:hypothetical protein
MNNLDEAMRNIVEALGIFTERLGDLHPNTLVAKSNLANILAEQHKVEEAYELRTNIVAQFTKLLGPEHLYTLFSRANLAQDLAILRKTSHAEVLRREVLLAVESRLELDHPVVIALRNAPTWINLELDPMPI